MRLIYLLFLSLLLAHYFYSNPTKGEINSVEISELDSCLVSEVKTDADDGWLDADFIRIRSQAVVFCKARSFSEQTIIFIDYGMHSGRKRLFVWDALKDSCKYKMMVAHGCGKLN